MMFKLTIDRINRDREAQNNSADSAFAAELKKIIDKPAQVKTNKNYGGDINPNA